MNRFLLTVPTVLTGMILGLSPAAHAAQDAAHDGPSTSAAKYAAYAGTYAAGPLATLEIGAVEDLI
ncbi:MAG: hypothetical protein ACODAA_06025, partial [Gemmatimonadota bacterium]